MLGLTRHCRLSLSPLRLSLMYLQGQSQHSHLVGGVVSSTSLPQPPTHTHTHTQHTHAHTHNTRTHTHAHAHTQSLAYLSAAQHSCIIRTATPSSPSASTWWTHPTSSSHSASPQSPVSSREDSLRLHTPQEERRGSESVDKECVVQGRSWWSRART